MEALHKQHCEVCRSDSLRIDPERIEKLLMEIPGWRKDEINGIERLTREYSFGDYRDAFGFANLIFNLAEQEDHHPAMLVEWGKVTVHWWTHKVAGLHLNDFIMAAKTDLVADSVPTE